jgi:hypothetical protein
MGGIYCIGTFPTSDPGPPQSSRFDETLLGDVYS